MILSPSFVIGPSWEGSCLLLYNSHLVSGFDTFWFAFLNLTSKRACSIRCLWFKTNVISESRNRWDFSNDICPMVQYFCDTFTVVGQTFLTDVFQMTWNPSLKNSQPSFRRLSWEGCTWGYPCYLALISFNLLQWLVKSVS